MSAPPPAEIARTTPVMKDQGDPLKVPSPGRPMTDKYTRDSAAFRGSETTTENANVSPTLARTEIPVTAPQQFQIPQGWGAQPPAPPQQFAQAPGGYAPPQQPQFPQQFQAPAAPMAPPQGYQYYQGQHPAIPMPGFPPPPQQYDPYAQMQPQAPAFTPEGGTLDEYLNQRDTGAQFWKFPQPGITRIGMVERELRDSDVRQVTFKGQPVRRQDGSISGEKSLSIPIVEPDGQRYVWEVKGHVRTKLTEVVRAAGVESGLPEGGSMLRVQFTHNESVGNGGAQRKVLDIQYARPNQVQGAPQQAAPAQQAPPAASPPLSAQQPAPVPSSNGQQDPAYAAWLAQQAAASPGSAYYQGSPAAQPPQQPDLQYATPVPGPQQYAQPAMQAPPTQAPGGPAPQPYQPPGMDPQAAAMFGNLLGGVPAQ